MKNATNGITKSLIAKGQMFILFPAPVPELDDNPKPSVWVKVANEVIDGEEVSLFVNNNAIVQLTLGTIKKFGVRDKWYITDTYYGANVRRGFFVPVEDLKKVDGICLEMGYPKYEMIIL